MSFLLFERITEDGKGVLRATGGMFSLAGYNLIYKAWKDRNCPINVGWHVSADELIQSLSAGTENYNTRRLIVDFHPSATHRIGIVELLDVYAFTWSYDGKTPSWTPLMLRMQNIYYEEFDQPIEPTSKAAIMNSLSEPPANGPDFVEFLYLNGSEHSWNWGKNGMTNAVFIQDEAREYFRKFF